MLDERAVVELHGVRGHHGVEDDLLLKVKKEHKSNSRILGMNNDEQNNYKPKFLSNSMFLFDIIIIQFS